MGVGELGTSMEEAIRAPGPNERLNGIPTVLNLNARALGR